MKMYLYKCENSENTINKKLENPLEIELTIKRDVEENTPIIILKLDSFEYNYVRIDDFNKFYFITKKERIAKNIYKLYLTLDVLETYKDIILQSQATYQRQAGDGIFGGINNLVTTGEQTETIYNSNVTLEKYETIILNTMGV